MIADTFYGQHVLLRDAVTAVAGLEVWRGQRGDSSSDGPPATVLLSRVRRETISTRFSETPVFGAVLPPG